MNCLELRRLLASDWCENEATRATISAHISACSHCRYGLSQLVRDVLVDEELSCEQSRRLFPAFYEATRRDHPLVEMDDTTMARMVSHLSHCESCRKEYSMLVCISELEERGETAD